jgi:hypothetical protein
LAAIATSPQGWGPGSEYSVRAPLEPWLGSLLFGRIDSRGDLRMAAASDVAMHLARAASDASVSSPQKPLTPV